MYTIWSLETYETLPSTQEAVKDLAMAGAEEGLAVQALMQTDGKGRQGRKWISQRGNLFLSLLLRPQGGAEKMGQISLLTGVALAKTLQPFGAISLKWPNDVMWEGKKCAGILLERESDDALIVGVGVNIASAPEGFAALGDGLERVRNRFLQEMELLYLRWKEEGFSAIRQFWLDYADEKGTPIKIQQGQHMMEGTFEGLDESGNLLFRSKKDGLKTISSGDVYLCS